MSAVRNDSPSLIGYAGLVRGNANFRFLWFGQIISLLGDWFDLIASASLVARLTESGLAVGGLFVVRMLAPFFVSPIAGVAADRYSRKRLLILADVFRAITVLGFLVVRDASQIWMLYTLTAIQLGLSGFFFPARNAILPDIVSPQELGAANALSSATWSVMLALGAALGGVVAGEWGIYPSFVIDAATFVASATLIAHIHYLPASALSDAEKSLGAALRQYVDGLRYLGQHPDVLVVALQKAAFALVSSGPFQVLQVRLTEQVFVIGEGGSTSLGLMYAVAGVGTGFGPIVARHFTGDRERPMRKAIALAYAITALGLALAAPLIRFEWVLVGTFLRGFGAGMSWVFTTQILLQIVPNRVRGRVFSSEFAMQTLMNAVGAAIGGWALDATPLGVSGTLWWTTVLTLVPGGLWVWWMATRKPMPSIPASLTPLGAPDGED